MSDDFLDDDDLEPEGADDTRGPKALRDARARAIQERDEARAEAAEAKGLKRENAFLKAGVKLDDADLRVTDFVKAYDGEVTAEAIREAATARGLVAAPQLDSDLGEAQRAAQVSAGATTNGSAAERDAEKSAALAALGPRATPYQVADVLERFDPASVIR